MRKLNKNYITYEELFKIVDEEMVPPSGSISAAYNLSLWTLKERLEEQK